MKDGHKSKEQRRGKILKILKNAAEHQWVPKSDSNSFFAHFILESSKPIIRMHANPTDSPDRIAALLRSISRRSFRRSNQIISVDNNSFEKK